MIYTVEDSANVVTEGRHEAIMEDVVESNSQFGPCVKFLFKVNDAEGEPGISGLCSAKKLSPATKLFKWLSAMNGGKLEKGDQVDPKDFIGNKMEILVESTFKDDQEFSNVTEVVKTLEPAF